MVFIDIDISDFLIVRSPEQKDSLNDLKVDFAHCSDVIGLQIPQLRDAC